MKYTVVTWIILVFLNHAALACPEADLHWLMVTTPDNLIMPSVRLEYLDFIRQTHPGATVVLKHQIAHLHNKSAVQRFFSDIKNASGSLIAIDQEGGRIQALTPQQGFFAIPSASRLGQIGQPKLTYQLARHIGYELKSYGVDWNLAPVADIAYPGNPVITGLLRGFSQDPAVTAEHTEAFVKGLQDSGLIATLKHFPGHGRTTFDTHKRQVEIQLSESELYQTELVPYRSALKTAWSVMSAHVSYPQICGIEPASLSSCMIQSHLRQKLGYEGIVITDAFGMDAIDKHYDQGSAVIKALRAGHDLVIVDYKNRFQVVGAVCQLAQRDPSFALQLAYAKARLQRLRKLPVGILTPSTNDLTSLGGVLHEIQSAQVLAH